MDNDSWSLVSPSVAAKIFNVSNETLRLWALDGKIQFTTTKGGHRRYKVRNDVKNNDQRTSVIYARVSSSKQQTSLENQKQRLALLYPKHRVITDIGSGINFKRKGLKTVLELLFKGNLKEVVVTNRDRLSRFGSELFDWIFKKHNAKIVVIDDTKGTDGSDEQELAEDLIAITTIFTARYHGKRGAKVRKKNKISTNSKTERTTKKTVRTK
jgi:predicted site-specific integrase-resolvase